MRGFCKTKGSERKKNLPQLQNKPEIRKVLRRRNNKTCCSEENSDTLTFLGPAYWLSC